MAKSYKDYKGEATRESEASAGMLRWVQARAENIREAVTAHDILRRNGVQLRFATGDREEQFPCPFHGVDRHPSARVYPATTKGPSHVWCFVCQKNWDAIGLWKKFSSGDDEVKFTRVLAEIERAYGISPPDRPPSPSEMADYVDPEIAQVELMFDICESNLAKARAAFDMRAHLTIGSLLDRMRYQFEHGALSPEKTRGVLQKVLDKITEREKSCPEG